MLLNNRQQQDHAESLYLFYVWLVRKSHNYKQGAIVAAVYFRYCAITCKQVKSLLGTILSGDSTWYLVK